MIVAKQIRAARALLNISQGELAKGTGVSLASICNFEQEITKPRYETLNALKVFLINQGIDFIGGDGVRLVQNVSRVHTLNGQASFARLLKDICTTVKNLPPEQRNVFWYGNNWNSALVDIKEMYAYYKGMVEIGAREKVIISHSCKKFYGPKEVTEYFNTNSDTDPHYQDCLSMVYGIKVAHVLKSDVFIIENKLFHERCLQELMGSFRRCTPIYPPARQFYSDDQKWGKVHYNAA